MYVLQIQAHLNLHAKFLSGLLHQCLDFMRLTTEKVDLYTQAVSNIFEKFPVIEYVFKFRFEESKTLISLVT